MYSQKELCTWFPTTISEKIVGVTSELVGFWPSRRRDVEAWCMRQSASRFCVLDDDVRLFEKNWRHLVLPDSKMGMTPDTVQQVIDEHPHA